MKTLHFQNPLTFQEWRKKQFLNHVQPCFFFFVVFFHTFYKGYWMHFVSIHVIEFSESLEDIVIILCSINVKIAKIGLTWFAKQQCLQLFCLFFFYTGVYKYKNIWNRKALWSTNTYSKCRTYEADLSCQLPVCFGNTSLADIHPLHTLTPKHTISYHIQYYSEE